MKTKVFGHISYQEDVLTNKGHLFIFKDKYIQEHEIFIFEVMLDLPSSPQIGLEIKITDFVYLGLDTIVYDPVENKTSYYYHITDSGYRLSKERYLEVKAALEKLGAKKRTNRKENS